MQKNIKIFISNLILIVLFTGLFELGLYLNYRKNHPEIIYKIQEVNYKDVLKYYRLQPEIGLNYTKQPLILAGCSYAYGQELETNQTFGYKLSHLTQRPVYNFSLPGKGLQHNLYFVQNKMYNNTIQNPEYYIYVFMNDQIRRLYTTVCMHDFTAYPEYVLDKNGELTLKREKYPFYKQFYVYYFFNNLYYAYFGSQNYEKHSKLVREYFREMNKSIKRDFPNIKFVILFYGDYKKYYGLSLDELQEEGIELVHTQDLSEVNIFAKEYHISENDFHPNEKAWDTLTPAFAKKLNL